MCMYMQLNTTNTIFLTIIKGKIKTLNTQVSKEKKSAYTADFFAYVAE